MIRAVFFECRYCHRWFVDRRACRKHERGCQSNLRKHEQVAYSHFQPKV